MRDYSIVSAKLWIGETGKQLRGNTGAQLLAAYLITSPHASMTGLYYCPLMYASQDTGMPVEEIRCCLDVLCDLGFCLYDDETETVFVLQMAKFQVGENLDLRDNRRTAIIRELEKTTSPFRDLFVAKYCNSFKLDKDTYPRKPRWRPKLSTVNGLTERDGRKCNRCGVEDHLEIDHVVAKILGGSNELSNLQFLCETCHAEKTAKDVELFWNLVEIGALCKGGAPPQSHPLPKGVSSDQRTPSGSQDQRSGSGDQDQEVGTEVSRREPRASTDHLPGLSIPNANGKGEPAPDASAVLLRIVASMKSEKFVVPGAGEQTIWDNAKRPLSLAEKLEDACPSVDVPALIVKLAGWTVANPKRAKRDLGRFVWNIATKEQDKPRIGGVAGETYRHGTDLADKVKGARRGGER